MNTRTGIAKLLCAKRLKYGVLRCLFKSVGRLSRGIQIGWQYGFDSGESLDYVYENKARGTGLIGRIMDKYYLDSAGWNGIRTRGRIIKDAISWTINKSKDSEEAIELIDIASGPGRYVLDVLPTVEGTSINAKLYDLDEKGLEFGRQRAKTMGVKNIEFKRRDAFAPDPEVDKMRPADIAIASGLYELFTDNEMVSRSLNVLNQRVREGGYLIYTNQPWHPQLEFIAEVLTNRNGEPWVMRCRSQEEMDNLVKAAGFEKLSMHSDEQGIFTVSIASKRSFQLSSLPASAGELSKHEDARKQKIA